MHSNGSAVDRPIARNSTQLSVIVRAAFPLFIMGIALYGLSHFTTGVSFAEIQTNIQNYSLGTLSLSFAAMVVSYLLLGHYDVLILPVYSEAKVSRWVLLLTGCSSMAVSNLFGFSWLTGGAIRFKVYTSRGVSFGAVAKLMGTAWAAFFAGLWTVIGIVMVANSTGFISVTSMPSNYVMLSGAALLNLIFTYFKWTWQRERSVGVGTFRIELPKAGVGISLTIITVLDLIATALTLYFLLPADLTQDFIYFIGLFSVALGLGVLSHSPGGLGVFDATIIAGLGAIGRSDVMVAIALYRVIYTVVPATLSLIGILCVWIFSHRDVLRSSVLRFHKSCEKSVSIIAASIAMLSGAILLISGTLPSDPTRLGLLRRVLPLELIEASHLLGSVSGVLLMIVARGLYRRMFRAWLVAMALFAVGLVVSLLKGFDWEEATSLALAMGILGVFRPAFYRASFNAGPTINVRWILTVCALTFAMSWIGFVAYSHAEFSNAIWWKFAWHGDASRFLRATLAISVLLAALFLNALLTKQATRLRPEPIPDSVRKLAKLATFAEAGIALTGDKRFVITPDHRAFLAYADTGNTLICKGDPAGDRSACIAAIWQFRELADKMGRRCAFYRVSNSFLPTFLDLGLQLLKIGEVASVDLHDFSLKGPKRRAWRNGKLRVEADDYQFEIINEGDIGRDFENLREVSTAWLASKLGQEKGFSLGSFNRAYLNEFDIAVLRHSETGRITAFANLMKSGDKSELSIDLMRYDPQGPVSSMDGLFAGILLWGHANGYGRFCLGASPLSGFEQHHLAPLWHRIGHFLFHNAEQFYHFAGLRQFKQKFDPDWSPEYLTVANRVDAAKVLYEVSVLIAKGSLDRSATPNFATDEHQIHLVAAVY